jgi:hypothetical protein
MTMTVVVVVAVAVVVVPWLVQYVIDWYKSDEQIRCRIFQINYVETEMYIYKKKIALFAFLICSW